MRVLVAARDGLDLDPVAADLAGEVGQVLGGGHDVDGGAGRRRGGQDGECGDAQESHGDLDQKGWAPCAPIANRNWNSNSLAGLSLPAKLRAAVLGADLAELARPEGQDERAAGVAQPRRLGALGVVVAHAGDPAAGELVLEVAVAAHGV